MELHERALGFDVPATLGMAVKDVLTPCLVIDLDAFERNVSGLQSRADAAGVKLRVHGKMHRCADAALYQIAQGACGICCQKVAEAEAFARAGIADILVSNQVRQPVMIDRLVQLPKLGARTLVCVDDLTNVAELSAAATRHGTEIEILIEIECGMGRCGGVPGPAVVDLAKAVQDAPGLIFSGIQAYHGSAQHKRIWKEREAAISGALTAVRTVLSLFETAGIACPIVGGAGTGTYAIEAASGLYTELQCGSYAFMDADYGRIEGANGHPISEFENALFLLSSVMSTNAPGRAVCDAGLKSQSVDSGLPLVHGLEGISYIGASDEHGILQDPDDSLVVGDKVHLIPGHCDPTCNVLDWYVCVRGCMVEALWPVTARGKSW